VFDLELYVYRISLDWIKMHMNMSGLFHGSTYLADKLFAGAFPLLAIFFMYSTIEPWACAAALELEVNSGVKRRL
jgi:hypothetical protein